MASTFGTLFRVATWGESHGGGIGVVVDGCPPRLPLAVEAIQHDEAGSWALLRQMVGAANAGYAGPDD